MASWRVQHIISSEVVGQHATKKAANAQAKEMTDAHVAIDAKHEGMPVGFIVVKAIDPPVQQDAESLEAD